MTVLRFACIVIVLWAVGSAHDPVRAADEATKPRRSTHFGKLARAYAEAMVEKGRDTYGPKHTPLFAAQMTRADCNVPEDPHKVFPPMDRFGLRYDDRAWGSANAHDHTGLYELLYALRGAAGDTEYADAADAAIRYTFEHLRSANTDLIAWGEELSWMLHHERPRLPGDGIMDGRHNGRPYDNDLHEPLARWSPRLWDRAFKTAPDGAKAFALGLWNHQIADQKTGAFSRHARYTRHGPKRGPSFPRVGAWMMLGWAKAYQHVDDDPRFDAKMIRAIETIADNYNNRRDPKTDALPAGANTRYDNVFWLTNNLMMTLEVGLILEIDGLPERTVGKLRELASRTDAVVLNKLAHNLDGRLNDQHPSFTRGFHHRAHTDKLEGGKLKLGDPRHPLAKRAAFSSDWGGGYGAPATSGVAMMMLSRAEQLGDTEQATAYRKLAMRAAAFYLDTEPDRSTVLHPSAFAGVIEFMLAAHRHSDAPRYLKRAAFFAEHAADLFFDDTSALPKVTSRHDFYEARSGGPALALAMYRLAQAQARARAETKADR